MLLAFPFTGNVTGIISFANYSGQRMLADGTRGRSTNTSRSELLARLSESPPPASTVTTYPVMEVALLLRASVDAHCEKLRGYIVAVIAPVIKIRAHVENRRAWTEPSRDATKGDHGVPRILTLIIARDSRHPALNAMPATRRGVQPVLNARGVAAPCEARPSV